MKWQDLAACSGMDLNIFFPRESTGPRERKGMPGEKERIEQAKGVCSRCPVRIDCLEYAIENDCTGIFGGTTTTERRNAGLP